MMSLSLMSLSLTDSNSLTKSNLRAGNNDIQPFVPMLVECLAKPGKTHDCIHGLASTTFVQSVEGAHLSIIVPLLSRGLQDRVQAIQRKSCLIADSMSKLVDDPVHAAPFIPKILPLCQRVSEEVSNPEVRQIATRALNTLQRIEQDAKEIAEVRSTSREWVHTQLADAGVKIESKAVTEHIVDLAMALIDVRSFEEEEWVRDVTTPFLKPFMSDSENEKAGKSFVERCAPPPFPSCFYSFCAFYFILFSNHGILGCASWDTGSFCVPEVQSSVLSSGPEIEVAFPQGQLARSYRRLCQTCGFAGDLGVSRCRLAMHRARNTLTC